MMVYSQKWAREWYNCMSVHLQKYGWVKTFFLLLTHVWSCLFIGGFQNMYCRFLNGLFQFFIKSEIISWMFGWSSTWWIFLSDWLEFFNSTLSISRCSNIKDYIEIKTFVLGCRIWDMAKNQTLSLSAIVCARYMFFGL